ncbi:hypothetical protein B0T25DRAFT_64570 [Lasiosphaeria hispida]|uniref:C2H2-type domain-containing protein n=1 Tax=Lasiosphaeria hispida TaxID=260671 RepID=A0AAJ0HWY6_9PEZI|nr:hypothetical protein B0T25DRAFT_64570 [Lasiosphaeria hispida]
MEDLAGWGQFIGGEDLETWNLHLEFASMSPWLVDGLQLPQTYLMQQGVSEPQLQPQSQDASLFPMIALDALAAYNFPASLSQTGWLLDYDALNPFPYPNSNLWPFPYYADLLPPESPFTHPDRLSLLPASPPGSPLPPARYPTTLPGAAAAADRNASPPTSPTPPALLSCPTTATINIQNTYFRCTLAVASGATCGKEFRRGSELDRHVATVHERARVEVCQLCGGTRKFTRRDTLGRHMRRVHGLEEGGLRKLVGPVRGVVR